MVRIKKRWEPKELTEFKKKGHISYNSLDSGEGAAVKRKIQESLCDEQFGLCAYCMTSIYPDTMRIEHFIPQSDSDSGTIKSLDYKNMLGVCDGGERFNTEGELSGNKNYSCDAHKGNKTLSLNPSVEEQFNQMKIYYSSDGKIHSDCQTVDFETELNDVLNLNVLRLVNKRKAAKQSVIRFIKEHGRFTAAQKEEKIRSLQTPQDGRLPAFYAVSVFFYEKICKVTD